MLAPSDRPPSLESKDQLHLAIPLSVDQLKAQNAQLAMAWRLHMRAWLEAEARHARDHDHAHDSDPNRHDERIRAHCLAFDAPLEWQAVAGWLDRLAFERGEQLLRVKGLLNVAGQEEPVVIQGVHSLFHPPSTLPSWPDADRASPT